MCGIAGVLLTEDRYPGEVQHLVAAMCRAQMSRGPDSAGVWADGRTGLGSVRLAVTGGVSGGSQPLRDSFGGISVYNGEIYNAATLSTSLAAPTWGAGFTDGRVLVGVLCNDGLNGLSQVRGPFALARFDPAAGRLLLVRDAVGKKPLYFARIDGGWAFASTVKSIHTVSGALRRRETAVFEYLVYRSVGGNKSAFDGVEQVPPGGWIELSIDGTMKTGRWWTVPESCEIYRDEREVRALVSESIKLRVEPNRPTAIFLSGGLDSSIVAATAAAAHPESKLTAVTIGYDVQGSEDETDFAAKLADHAKVEIDRVQLKVEEVPNLMEEAAHLTEDPIQDPVVVPTLKLARSAAAWTKVTLTGDGADEVWGGYARFEDPPDCLSAYLPRCTIFTPQELGLASAPESYLEGVSESSKNLTTLDRILRLEVSNRMRNYHLSRLDKICMGVGLEPRSPFLDRKVVTEGLSIPVALKVMDGIPKGLLIHAFHDLLPEWLIKRTKQPFSVPVGKWLSDGLFDVANDVLRSRNTFTRPLIDPDPLLDQLTKGEPIGEPAANRIWSLLQLEYWDAGFAREMEADR